MHGPAFGFKYTWAEVGVSFFLVNLYPLLGDSLWFLWRTSLLPVALLGVLFTGPLTTHKGANDLG